MQQERRPVNWPSLPQAVDWPSYTASLAWTCDFWWCSRETSKKSTDGSGDLRVNSCASLRRIDRYLIPLLHTLQPGPDRQHTISALLLVESEDTVIMLIVRVVIRRSLPGTLFGADGQSLALALTTLSLGRLDFLYNGHK